MIKVGNILKLNFHYVRIWILSGVYSVPSLCSLSCLLTSKTAANLKKKKKKVKQKTLFRSKKLVYFLNHKDYEVSMQASKLFCLLISFTTGD